MSLRDQAKKLKDDKEAKEKQDKILKKEGKILKEERKIERDIESLIPPKSPRIQIKIEEDISKDEDSKLEDLT